MKSIAVNLCGKQRTWDEERYPTEQNETWRNNEGRKEKEKRIERK